MRVLDSALSALRTSQQALQTIGNNIANASTPGYTRQQVDLVDRRPLITGGLSIGQGVDVAAIRRVRNEAVESALLNNTSATGRQSAELETLRQVESLLTPSEASIHARVQNFFSQWQLLSAEPSETVRRQEVLQSAVAIADEINSLGAAFGDLKSAVAVEIEATVDEVNRLSAEVATVIKEIQRAEARGSTPNDLLDRRDQLVTQLAELIGAEVVDAGAVQGVRLANGDSVVTTQFREFSVAFDGENIVLSVGERALPVSPTTGRLAGLLNAHNAIIPGFNEQLTEFAAGIVAAVNTVHASGLGAGGDLTFASSTRSIVPSNVPLSEATTDIPITDGQLAVGITNQTTGERSLYAIPIDSDVTSLDDLTTALDGLPGLTATIDGPSGRLFLTADAGFAFDTTGGLPSSVTVDSATGTSLPAVSGQYRGDANDEWTLTVSGSGAVGTDADITLQVRNSVGQLIANVSVGQGYAPGDPINLPDGVILRVPPGTLNDADTYRLPVIAEPDTSGVLAALGVNDLFIGTRPGTLGVNVQLLNDPSQLAVSQTGESGDNRIATRMADVGRQSLLASGTRTFSEYLADVSGRTGVLVAFGENDLTGLSQLGSSLSAERESISGVSPDEELIQMLAFQRMFQTAARFLTSVNDTLDELLGLVR